MPIEKIKKEHITEITKMREQGLKFKDIADKLNEKYNLNVTANAITARLRYEELKESRQSAVDSLQSEPIISEIIPSNENTNVKTDIKSIPVKTTLVKLEPKNSQQSTVDSRQSAEKVKSYWNKTWEQLKQLDEDIEKEIKSLDDDNNDNEDNEKWI